MPKPITTSEASINTCTVELKTMQVGKKQMTLSVFRQLPEEHLVTGFSDMNGMRLVARGKVWGLVNYFWDKFNDCTNDSWLWEQRLHVVYQRDRILYRCLIWPMRYQGFFVWGDATARKLTKIILDNPNGKIAGDQLSRFALRWERFFGKLARLDQLFIAV